MSTYSIPVTIYATVYVKAQSKDEAIALARKIENACIEVREGFVTDALEVSGRDFDDAELPNVSLSPAMTIGDLDPGYIETAYEGA